MSAAWYDKRNSKEKNMEKEDTKLKYCGACGGSGLKDPATVCPVCKGTPLHEVSPKNDNNDDQPKKEVRK